MSFTLNKVMIAGNLTRDPEIRTVSDKSVCSFGIAINNRYKNKAGELKEEVTFIDIEAWGKSADFAERFLKKGAGVYAEGRLKLEEWTDKTTQQKRTKLKVVADQLNFTTPKIQDEAAPKAMAASASGRPAPVALSDEEESQIPF